MSGVDPEELVGVADRELCAGDRVLVLEFEFQQVDVENHVVPATRDLDGILVQPARYFDRLPAGLGHHRVIEPGLLQRRARLEELGQQSGTAFLGDDRLRRRFRLIKG